MEFTDFSIEQIENKQKAGGNIFDSPTPFKILDFSGNSNVLKTPKVITRAFKRTGLNFRPDVEYKKAIQNLASKHSSGYENITLCRNTFSSLDLCLKALKARGALAVMPCETMYKDICRINNCDIVPYILQEKMNFKMDCDDVIEKITLKSDTFLMSNPNNATGRVVKRADMRTILDFCLTKGVYVIVDESYMDFVPESQSVISLVKEYYNLVVIRSLPEYYNVTGIGASYIVTSPEIIENIKENQLKWQLDTYGALLCENAYCDEKFDLKTKKWIFNYKRDFLKKLDTIKSVKTIHSDCHFILIKLEDTSATTVYNRMLRSNILIRDASDFTGLDGSYIRVAVRDEKSNDIFLETLVRCLI